MENTNSTFQTLEEKAKKAVWGVDFARNTPPDWALFWRSLPRKPAEDTRSVKQGFSFTEAEIEAIRANAAAAGKTIVDWIVLNCAQK